MKTLVCVILGVGLGIFFSLPEKEISPIEVDEFWRVNGTYANDGEMFEVFYPPLDNLKF